MGASSNEQTAEPVDVEMESENAQDTQDADMSFVGLVGSLEPMQDNEVAEMLLMQLGAGRSYAR